MRLMEKLKYLAGYGGETPPGFEPHYVYILTCRDRKTYTGCSKNLEERLRRHQEGLISFTASRLPIKLAFSAWFPNKYLAYKFEKYLKSGSGRAFLKRHLLDPK